MEHLSFFAILTIACGGLSLIILLTLHFVSPEFQPGWRMISEYAMGKYKWLLTIFFILWGISSILLSILLWNIVSTTWADVGAALIFISGIGAIMGGLFDVKHKLHGVAFAIGVPFLPVASLIITYHLTSTSAEWHTYQFIALLSAHMIWISLVLMAVTMMILFSGFKKAGLAMGPDIEPPASLPEGVIGINGYANRFLVLCYISWQMIIATIYILVN